MTLKSCILEHMSLATGKFAFRSLAKAIKNLNCDTNPLTLSMLRLEDSVREDLRFLKSQPLIRQEIKDNAKGYIWDIKTGKLTQISFEGRSSL
jgi:carbonic anhydrase